MTYNTVMLTKLEQCDLEMMETMIETSQQHIVAIQQTLRLAMDAPHGLLKFSNYIGEQFTDVALWVEKLFPDPEALSPTKVVQIAQRVKLMGRRLDEIELKTALEVINLV